MTFLVAAQLNHQLKINSTITSVSTPPGRGGISVIRISGPKSLNIVKKILKHPRKVFKARYAYFNTIFSIEKNEIDKAIIIYFKSPHSYTGEDTVEISCHGSIAITNTILENLFFLGCKPAKPGEFTKRAFLNGKIDLSQAEAVADLISSENIISMRANYKILKGDFSIKIKKLKNKMVDILSLIESELDFSEDEITFTTLKTIKLSIKKIIDNNKLLINTYKTGRLITDGASIAITGKPNAGKSSLFNSILSEKRALVSNIAGTTRDAIEAKFQINNLPVKFIDTAGIRKNAKSLEKQGILITKNYIENSDLILNIIDSSLTKKECVDQIKNFGHSNKVLHILNKIDLPNKLDFSLKPFNTSNIISLSALNGVGVNLLLNKIYEFLHSDHNQSNTLLIVNPRHKSSLKKLNNCLVKSLNLCNDKSPTDIIAAELRLALNHLDDILGITTPEEILNNIFAKFCIGK